MGETAELGKRGILVGTCGWTDRTLLEAGTFYPPEVVDDAEERLRFYASQFPIVEVDSTYYFPPTERNAALWMERTPADFTFDIKAYALLTNHPTKADSLYRDLRDGLSEELARKRNLYREQLPPKVLDEVWERFRAALMPLHSAGKLGAVLFQFPQWFVIGRKSKQYVVECKERLPDYRIAVEFRHKSWMEERNQEETLSFLAEHDLPFVCVDMPQGHRSSIPPVVTATAPDLALVRFHGHSDKWTSKDIYEKFGYRYSTQELSGWAPKLRELSDQVGQTHVLMNNCYSDYAQRNAAELIDLLSGEEEP